MKKAEDMEEGDEIMQELHLYLLMHLQKLFT